eukprot:PhF_6_TR30590/c0_g1_i2/m.45011
MCCIGVALSCGYMLIPCSVPTNYIVFLFANRLLYNTAASLSMVLGSLLFIQVPLRNTRQRFLVVGVVIIYNTLDLLRLNYLSSLSWFTAYVEIFNVINWFTMIVTFAYCLRKGHPSISLWSRIVMQFCSMVLVMYLFLCGIELVTVLFTSTGVSGSVWQPFVFALFLLWCNVSQRVMQSLARRTAINISISEQRFPSWFDLLRAQMFLFLPYSMQLAYYRLLFVNLGVWYFEALAIGMHFLQDLLLYPCRILPSVRKLERHVLSRSRLGRLILSPVLPLTVHLDILCADFVIRKLAEVTTLILFVIRLWLFRSVSFVSECSSDTTMTLDEVFDLQKVSGAFLVMEMCSTMIMYWVATHTTQVRRAFLFKVCFTWEPLVYFVGCIVVTNCSVVFADALRHVKFE